MDVFWAASLALALVLLGGAALRVASVHERLVVSRFGEVTRVGGPGLVFRVPGVERVTRVSLHPVDVPLVLSATTLDGVPVRLLASARCRISDPALSTLASPDPVTAAAYVVENTIEREVAGRDLAALLPTRAQLESGVPNEANAATAALGVEVLEVRVTDLETRLTPDLLRRIRPR